MNVPDVDRFKKSSFSGLSGCVEVAHLGQRVHVRDAKQQGAGPVLTFNSTEWLAFVRGVRAGEFDGPSR